MSNTDNSVKSAEAKTIEEIKNEYAQQFEEENFADWLWSISDSEDAMDMISRATSDIMEAYAQQEREIAVEMALRLFRDKLLKSGLNNDFDVMAKYAQIMEKLNKK